MTKQERLSGNRIIGEFVGKSFQLSHISDYKNAPDDALPPMKYHTDWNSLMDSWFKFRDLKLKGSINRNKHRELKDIISNAICYGSKETAFINLIKAIKWYNTTK
jgi:hypothetical protein